MFGKKSNFFTFLGIWFISKISSRLKSPSRTKYYSFSFVPSRVYTMIRINKYFLNWKNYFVIKCHNCINQSYRNWNQFMFGILIMNKIKQLSDFLAKKQVNGLSLKPTVSSVRLTLITINNLNENNWFIVVTSICQKLF